MVMIQDSIGRADTRINRAEVRNLYVRLRLLTQYLSNDEPLARMLASWRAGLGVLPTCMGLAPDAYHAMLARHFSGIRLPENAVAADMQRQPERADLRALLLDNRARHDLSELWIADIVVAACMGGNHLWEDLGLWSRRDLSELLQTNFPSLTVRNHRDMKWKNFLYKQLCIQEDIYTCRSPSCELCTDYEACFGPEESYRQTG